LGKSPAEAIDVRFLISALAMWLISAAVIVPLAALMAHLLCFDERALAYLSSAISFAVAFIAGAKAMSVRKRKALMTELICGLCIVLLALTIGFVVAGDQLQADGILSVVSFTLAGCLAGGLLFPVNKKARTNKKMPRLERHSRRR